MQGQRTSLQSLQSHKMNPTAEYKQNQVKSLEQINWATSDTKRLCVHINIFTLKRKWILSSVISNQWLCRYRWSWMALRWLKIPRGTNHDAPGLDAGAASIPSQKSQPNFGYPDDSVWQPVIVNQKPSGRCTNSQKKACSFYLIRHGQSRLCQHVAVIFPLAGNSVLLGASSLTQTKHFWMNILNIFTICLQWNGSKYYYFLTLLGHFVEKKKDVKM